MSSNLSQSFAQAFSNPWTFYSTMMPYLSPAYSNFGYPFGVNTATPPWMGIQPQQSPFAQATQGQAGAPTAFSQYMANAMANPMQLNQPGVANTVSPLSISTNLTTNPSQQQSSQSPLSLASYTPPTVNPLSISTSLAGASQPAAPAAAQSSSNSGNPVPLSQQQMLTAMGWLPSVASGTPGGPVDQSKAIFMIDPNTGSVINTQTGQTYQQGNQSGAEAPPGLTAQGMAGWTGDPRFLPPSTNAPGGGGGNSGGQS